MRCYLSFVMILLAAFLVACDTDDTPPSTRIVVVTPQPTPLADSTQIALEATVESLRATNIAMQLTLEAVRVQDTDVQVTTVATPPETATATGVASPTPEPPTATPMPTATIPPSAFPTPRVELVSVVEQLFERGRMIWFRENRMIWVLIGDEVDPESGTWLCFNDTFREGEVEFLPTFEPPANATTTSTLENILIQQPIRGFGKLWRENNEIHQSLGWALTSEVEHSARREYVAGGVLDLQDNYTPGPGEWRVQSFYNETLLFYEAELGVACPSGTWRLRRQ